MAFNIILPGNFLGCMSERGHVAKSQKGDSNGLSANVRAACLNESTPYCMWGRTRTLAWPFHWRMIVAQKPSATFGIMP